MDLNKSMDFFDPNKVKEPCHVIGCGSIGGNVAELLARYGIKNIVLWDADIVESHNIANQIYTEADIGDSKVGSLATILTNINSHIDVETIDYFYESDILSGYVFICVDNIKTRKDIVESNLYNTNIKAMFDFRTTLLEGETFAADWSKLSERKSLKNSMDFTEEEAKANTPVSACGFELSVSPVVKATAINGIINFTNFVNGNPMKKVITFAPYSYNYLAM